MITKVYLFIILHADICFIKTKPGASKENYPEIVKTGGSQTSYVWLLAGIVRRLAVTVLSHCCLDQFQRNFIREKSRGSDGLLSGYW